MQEGNEVLETQPEETQTRENGDSKERIVVENLYKIFGPHPDHVLKLLESGKTKDEIMQETKHGVGVADASFVVKEGEILVVMGLSGSGKSTLVRCLNRLIEPTYGKVLVNGVDVTRLDKEELRQFRQKHFGMVFQHFALFPHRKVLPNVEYGLEIQGVEPEKRKKKAMEALEQVGLVGWEDSFPAQLSGGMQQRVGLARALALDADIMLMDEAFSALDPLIRRDMQDELISLQDTMQKTIVFISHDLDEALKLGDRIILMKDGKIVQKGTAEDILTRPANGYVAKFVEDVDMSKVITAEGVMLKPAEMAYLKSDGPKSALHKMRHSGVSSLFVRKDKKLHGLVTASDVAAIHEKGEKSLESVIRHDFHTVPPDAQANVLFPLLTESKFPVAVVNEKGRLVGVVTEGSLIAGLSEKATFDENKENE